MPEDRFRAACNKAEERLTVVKFEAILKDIYTRIFIRTDPDETDPELRNHYYFLRIFEPYLLLKAAIKHGDIGYISRALDIMTIYILGSSSKNYAMVSMFLAYHTRSKGSDPRIGEALLANSIVNETGKANGWKEIDLFNGHLNKSIKETFRYRANSSVDFVHAMDYASLNGIQFANIRALINGFFGVFHSGKHHTKDAEKDIDYYANILRTSSSFLHRDPSKRIDVITKGDLFKNGFRGIQERIKRFNDSLPGCMTGGEDAEELDELAKDAVADQFFGDTQDDDQDDMMDTEFPPLREALGIPIIDPGYDL